MPVDDDHDVAALNELLDAGWISEVVFEIKSGKEATVYCCRGCSPLAMPADGRNGARDAAAAAPPGRALDGSGGLLAAKVYRDLSTRRFRNSAMYQAGRVHLAREGRAQRAAQNRTAFGREMEQALWIDCEWEILHRLFDAGLDVPRPLHRTGRAILMPFLGTDEQSDAPVASPMLHQVAGGIDGETAGEIVDRLLWNIEQMLDLHVVHGDLSPFNIMWHGDRAIIIDFPQAVDPRLNPAAQSLLSRDIANVCDWGRRLGICRDAAKIVADLWAKFITGELG